MLTLVLLKYSTLRAVPIIVLVAQAVDWLHDILSPIWVERFIINISQNQSDWRATLPTTNGDIHLVYLHWNSIQCLLAILTGPAHSLDPKCNTQPLFVSGDLCATAKVCLGVSDWRTIAIISRCCLKNELKVLKMSPKFSYQNMTTLKGISWFLVMLMSFFNSFWW